MAAAATVSPPDFEIDHRAEYARYFIDDPAEISFHIDLLVKRASLATAYLDDGRTFFLTTTLGVDRKNSTFFIDAPQAPEALAQALLAKQTTLVVSQNRIRLQLRLGRLEMAQIESRPVLVADIPPTLLRLQRREFFRLEPPAEAPLRCRLRIHGDDSTVTTLQLGDISGGGISLIAPSSMAENFQRDTLFRDSRLDIPDEPVITADLRVRKAIELSSQDGTCSLRIGCEFLDLRPPRLAIIERYIARIMRERNARSSGLIA